MHTDRETEKQMDRYLDTTYSNTSAGVMKQVHIRNINMKSQPALLTTQKH